ncbi:phosphopantetheine adenylyltransferase [Nocardia puris]|uniref:DoxX-like protein n=1 Tax=Nocardia puris TaxID=208602 RepID=A0A366D0P9_9NOCA|nr:hypothetical protein [Nocardia puris]MBF6215151.1 phosphopantetheine adenylyltransferase [Nocardia puris]MBF6369662.1 phosphopantetheine adenylyltransferase [Nocardia puris]MBF6462520.1 phosphopantetheine adenylyltransferase [Nocardia puris]RBO83611.1 hypothetical protein DFR74_11835 [Nocardia puris]
MVAEVAAATLMLGVGLVHVAPGVVAFAPGRAASVYGTDVANPDLELLLRHRAVLLASTGAALITGALVPPVRVAALTAGVVSVSSFLALTAVIGTAALNAKTRRVARVDVGALAALVGAGCLLVLGR